MCEVHKSFFFAFIFVCDMYYGFFAQKDCRKEDYNPCSSEKEIFIPTAHMCVKVVAAFPALLADEAQKQCEQSGGTLVEIWDSATQKGLEDLIKQYGRRYFWIGLHRTSGQFKWKSAPGRRPTYWKTNIGRNRGSCVVIFSASGEWTDSFCHLPQGYICQAAKLGDPPKVPIIEVEVDRKPHTVFVGNQLRATCRAQTGPEWTVTWFYNDGQGDAARPLDSPGLQHREVFQEMHGRCKRVILSNFTSLVIEQPWGEPGREVTCKVHPVGAPKTPCTARKALCGTRKKIIAAYSNLQPNMTVDYHDAGEVLHLGRTAVFHCTAIVGPLGNVSWEIDRLYPDRKIRIGPDDPRAMYFRGDDRSEDIAPGLNEVIAGSRLRLIFTNRTQGKIISCYSFVVLPNATQKLNSLYSDSPQLQVKYGPQTPNLTVHYHEFRDRVIIGWNLTATCSACVGEEGAITWTFLDSHNGTLATEDLESLNMMERSSREENITDCGTKVTSNVIFEVKHFLHGVRLVCFSYNGTYLPGVRVDAYSWLLITEGTLIEKSYFIEAFPVLFSLLVLILLLMALRRWLEEPQRTQQPEMSVDPGPSNLRVHRQTDRRPPRRPSHRHHHHHQHHHYHHRHKRKIYNPAPGTNVDDPSWKIRKPRNSQEPAAVVKTTVRQTIQHQKLRPHRGRTKHPLHSAGRGERSQRRHDHNRAGGGAKDKQRSAPVAGRGHGGRRVNISSITDPPQRKSRDMSEPITDSMTASVQSSSLISTDSKEGNGSRGSDS